MKITSTPLDTIPRDENDQNRRVPVIPYTKAVREPKIHPQRKERKSGHVREQ